MFASRSHGRPTGRSLALTGALLLGLGASAAPASAAPRVVQAGQAVKVADHALVSDALAAARCARSCATQRTALQRAGGALGSSHRRMASAVRAKGAASAKQSVPMLKVTGRTLSWAAAPKSRAYVMARRVPGQATVYSLVAGTRTTPPATPGLTVRYAVRVAVDGARWSSEKAIAYAAATSAPAPAQAAAATAAAPKVVPVAATTPAPSAASSNATHPATSTGVAAVAAKPVDAPVLSIAGGVLTWTRVAQVRDYVLVRKMPGMDDEYSAVTGTTVTPAAAPGKDVRYSVRTAVDGSAWAPEQQVSYPAAASAPAPAPASASTPAPAPAAAAAPAPAPAPATSGDFQFGINSGSALQWELGHIQPLAAKHARMEFDISSSVASMAPIVEAYARAGIQPLLLAGFSERMPTVAEARNVATWAAAFGPGGTFWAGKNLPASVQVTDIEFGNETNNPWQYSTGSRGGDWYQDPIFLQRARDYASRVRDASIAVAAANAGVGILAVGDQYSGYRTWVDAMFEAVPNLSSYVAGWTVHPYGQDWRIPMDTMISSIRSHGGPQKPLFATEWGLSTDNGHCLSDNFGWDKCMSYDNAATTLEGAVTAMRARYGTQLAAIYLYSTSDLRAPGESTDREHYFGAVRSDGSPKGAYTASVKRLLGASA